MYSTHNGNISLQVMVTMIAQNNIMLVVLDFAIIAMTK
jgi:hypothetical protein